MLKLAIRSLLLKIIFFENQSIQFLKDGKWVQLGIISWGIGCGRSKFPGIFTEYLEWIEENIENL